MQTFSRRIHRFPWVVQHSLFSPALSPVPPVISSLLALPSPDSSQLSHLTPLCLSRNHPGARHDVLVTKCAGHSSCAEERLSPEHFRGVLGTEFQLQHQGSTARWDVPRLCCGTAALAGSVLQLSQGKAWFFLVLNSKCGASQLGEERLENTLVFTFISLYICVDMSRYTHRCINIYVCLSYIYTYMHTPASHSRILLLERRMSCPFLEVFKFN